MSDTKEKWFQKNPRTTIIMSMIIVLGVGYVIGHFNATKPSPGFEGKTTEKGDAPQAAIKWWTCAMHPEIHDPGPGRCRKCGMELIPVTEETDNEEVGMRQLTLSDAAIKLMDIETSPVARRFVTAKIRMVGNVGYDETRLGYITAWVPGRLDRLYVDYTGIPVKKGDHMVSLYSPELLSAQEELLQAKKAVVRLEKSDIASMRESAQATVEASREKLRLLGLTPEQISEIETRGTTSDHVTIYSPMGGIVIHKNAQEGMYVQTGTRIYTIADLNQLWVRLDAYESDLPWLRYGQKVEFTTDSYPGETFTGQISFIDPFLNPKTRTVKVRVNVPNLDGKLKPDMFVRAVVHAEVAAGGKVMDSNLAGKWICPMHPDVIKDDAGECDICGMPLASTESLGYVAVREAESVKPLVIPASAPLITGERAVVYVQLPKKDRPTFEGREIVLGPRTGNWYIVHEGLAEGDHVVTRGNFKIDSALQISAKPSMMTPPNNIENMSPMNNASSTLSPSTEIPNKLFLDQLNAVVESYLPIQEALAEDNRNKAGSAATQFLQSLAGVNMELVHSDAHMLWMKHLKSLKTSVQEIEKAQDIEAQRKAFALLSEVLAQTSMDFSLNEKPLYELRCPMAFDGRGATWLQHDEDVRNPYFGEMMLKCGDVERTLSIGTQATPEDDHHE